MLIAEPLGVVGAPSETLRALQEFLADSNLADATLIFVTDTQGQRESARYAVLVKDGDRTVVTVDAFGGRFGEEGVVALQQLARWAQEQGITRVLETVKGTYDFNRVMREPDEGELQTVLAAANPSDLNIYIR